MSRPTEQEWAEAALEGVRRVESHFADPTEQEYADAVLEQLAPLITRTEQAAKAEALRETARWVADGIGYPVQVAVPSSPPPPALWEAIVDHVHADSDSQWHGSELDRDEVDSWLRDESGHDREATP